MGERDCKTKRRSDGEQHRPYYGAPVVILVWQMDPQAPLLSGSRVLENMMLAAMPVAWGTVCVTS